MVRRTVLIAFLLVAFLLLGARPGRAYSVLAHEAIVDTAWKSQIEPLLLRRFPRTTPEQLGAALGYAYGGCVIQDLGYYPFGSKFFSNLLHYVRSGDFVQALIKEARTVNEYAFALGALAHYAADNTGHPEAINRAVPLLFPKLRGKYGDRVTYQQAPNQHVLVEFSFDVVHAAAGRYGPEAYTRFIGFDVAEDVIERAFFDVYSVPLSDVFPDFGLAVGSYRFAVSQMIPAVTRAAWKDERENIARLIPNVTERSFVFSFSRGDFEQRYGSRYQRPAWFARFIAFFFNLLPKIGPLKVLSFETPTPEAEKMFGASLTDARATFSSELAAVGRGNLKLTNTNYDTGRPIRFGEYTLADKTYAELVERLDGDTEKPVSPELRAELASFYGHAQPPSDKKERKRWVAVQRHLEALSISAN